MQLWPISSWPPRRGPRFEIRRYPDDGHAHVRPDPHRDYVLCDRLAAPLASVDPLGDDIDEAVVDAISNLMSG